VGGLVSGVGARGVFAHDGQRLNDRLLTSLQPEQSRLPLFFEVPVGGVTDWPFCGNERGRRLLSQLQWEQELENNGGWPTDHGAKQ
jgi:hypothetical protein